MSQSSFVVNAPHIWRGYYRRIPGDEFVFHLRFNQQMRRWWPVIEWKYQGYTATCFAAESPAVHQLARSIEALKRAYAGAPGGSFQINEFGQVLAPVNDQSYRIFYLGDFSERLSFDNPFEPGHTFHLGPEPGIQRGDLWSKPYLGVPYNLSKSGNLYRRHQSDEGSEAQYLERPYPELRRNLTALRGSYNAIRFIINLEGIILTKKRIKPDNWQPVYVGQLDLDRWFTRQSP